MRRGRMACWNELLGIFVADLVERERTAARHVEGGGEKACGMERREAADRAQATLAVGMEPAPDLGERALEADRAHHVLQALAGSRMHVNVARRDALQSHVRADHLDRRDPAFVIGTSMPLHL